MSYNEHKCRRNQVHLYGIMRYNKIVKIMIAPMYMMTSSNGNIFRITGHLCGEFTGHRWISRTKASDAELWRFLWSAPEYTVKQTIVRLHDLRRHRAHYDVIIMNWIYTIYMFGDNCQALLLLWITLPSWNLWMITSTCSWDEIAYPCLKNKGAFVYPLLK